MMRPVPFLTALAVTAASAAALAGAPSVAADTVPAPASPSSTVAVLGTDQSLWTRSPSGQWTALGGRLLGPPAAVDIPAGPTVYIGIGRDHNLWERTTSQGWQTAAPGAYCVDSAAAIVTGTGSPYTVTVACTGRDGSLWWSQSPVTVSSLPTFTTWHGAGGRSISGPAVTLLGGQLQFLVTGLDSRVWTYTAGTGMWAQTGWACLGRPLATVAPGGPAFFGCRGTNGSLWYAIGTSTWGTAANAGGSLIQPLSAFADAGGGHLVVQGTDWSAWRFDTATRAWSSLGGRVWPGCAVQPLGAGCGKVIEISLAGQWLYAYQDGALVYNTPVTTGRPALPTPPGTYSVLRKVSPWLMTSDFPPSSPYWYPPSWVTYTLWFRNDGYAIHDAPWRATYGPGTQAAGSHGCVNVPMPFMATLYSWADVGTPVIVF